MSGLDIRVRPQPASGRHGEVDASIASETATNLAQKSLFVFDMFQHIEEPDGWQCSVTETRLLQGRLDHGAQSARLRMPDTVGPRFNQNHRQASLRLQRRSHEAVATADIEERTSGGKPPQQSQQTGIAMGEPERTVLNGKAVAVPRRRIGNRLRAAPAPNPVRIALQAIREKREVKRRGADRQTAGRRGSTQPSIH